MRGDLAAALLHEPAILFLDEPTIGLDVVAKERIREFLANINRERGVTVMLTTHDLADIERLCQRVMIIDHGRVIYDGGLEALRTRFGRQRTLVVDLDRDGEWARRCANAELVRRDGPRVWLRFDREATTAAALIADVAARYRVRDLTVEEPAIEGDRARDLRDWQRGVIADSDRGQTCSLLTKSIATGGYGTTR